ncbi:MAG: carbamate kinase [Bacteroidales bacterium]|jgi:carbamate kinase|nr:carbamate kinase [Bacteroidales bacterium]
MATKLAVIAFGGNALLRSGQKGTYQQQRANVNITCWNLAPLLLQDYGIVIVHGNGPQVGNGLLRHQAGEQIHGLPAQPMDFCGAETQGSIAYLIESGMDLALTRLHMDRKVVSLVSRVEVSADDPMFQHPTKPVGPFYPKPQPDGALYKEDAKGRGWRKVVASPEPLRIANIDLVGRLAREGYIVITAGGGGIPVVRENGLLRGIEAVIDKDLASALCAVEIGAEELYILTDVPKVYLNFRKPFEKALDSLTVAQCKEYLADGQFGEGSMAPKIRAAIYFLEHGGKTCIITEAGELGNPSCGTRIIE